MKRIRVTMAQPFNFGDHELYMTTRVGIAVFPDDGETADDLPKNAD